MFNRRYAETTRTPAATRGSKDLFGTRCAQGQPGTPMSLNDILLIFSSAQHAARLKSSSLAYNSDALLENQ